MSDKEDVRKLLEKVLVDLKRGGDIDASAIISRDGILLASDIPRDVHAETFAAMSATMLGAAETAISELKRGVPERLIAESTEGKVIATGAGSKALLTILTGPEAGLGLILVNVDKAADQVKELL